MLRLINTFNHLPQSYDLDPDSYFEPGQIGSLRIKNGKVVVGVCDGLNPEGIIDDIRTDKFRVTVIDENIILPITYISVNDKNETITSSNIKHELKNTNIIVKSFKSNIPVSLHSRNGVIEIPKGTPLNFSSKIHTSDKYNAPDSIRLSCSYSYNILGGDDSTLASQKVIVWNKISISQTNMYDTCADYSQYNNLYVTNGLLTTIRSNYNCPTIGVVLTPPSNKNAMLEFLFDPKQSVSIGGK